MLEEEGEAMDDIKNRLGDLADANEVEEDIGPAPDGFESPQETAEEQPATTAPAEG